MRQPFLPILYSLLRGAWNQLADQQPGDRRVAVREVGTDRAFRIARHLGLEHSPIGGAGGKPAVEHVVEPLVQASELEELEQLDTSWERREEVGY